VRRLQHQLDADEREDDREALAQVVEPVEQAGQQEVQGAQAEDREGVGRVDDEQLVADREDGRDAVDGEHEVGHLDRDDHREQRGRHATTVLPDEEPGTGVLVAHRHDLAQHAHAEAGAGVELVVVVLEQLVGAEQQDRGHSDRNDYRGGCPAHRDTPAW